MISGHQEFFFLVIWWAGYFFPFFSHKLFITFVLHAIFFSDKRLQEIFFQNHPPTPPPPLLQELNGRPLMVCYGVFWSRQFRSCDTVVHHGTNHNFRENGLDSKNTASRSNRKSGQCLLPTTTKSDVKTFLFAPSV